MRWLLIIFFATGALAGQYQIPASRSITWYPAGLDIKSGIPNEAVTNTAALAGLHPWGNVNDAVTIQNLLYSSPASNTIYMFPAGTFLVDLSTLTDPRGNHGHLTQTNPGIVLRGAGGPVLPPWIGGATNTTATTILFTNGVQGPYGDMVFVGGFKDTSWVPGIQTGIGVTNGYTQGSTSVMLSNVTGLAVGMMLCLYENRDSTWVDDKSLTFLGEDSGPDAHVWAQYFVITGISGNTTVNLDHPIYQVTPNASTVGVFARGQTSTCIMSGIENMRLIGCGAGEQGVLSFRFTQNCWARGCETYAAGGYSGGSPHIWCDFSYADEFRRNYCHFGTNHDSGSCYGIEFYHWNSRHKVEDNIVRETRHSIIFEGGGSGNVILYNFTDDNWESVQGQPNTVDNTILSESTTINHGSHPFMNLWEGQSCENFEADYTQGSSSHNTAFRNSIRGYRTSYALASPFFWNLCEVQNSNRFENFVCNIVGSPGMSGRPGWAGGTTINNNVATDHLADMWRFGVSSDGGTYLDTQSYATVILQGNYDYASASIFTNTDSANTVYVNSLYYTNGTRPAWYASSLPWVPYGSDISTTGAGVDRTNIPAGYRFVFGADPPNSTIQSASIGTATVGTATIAK